MQMSFIDTVMADPLVRDVWMRKYRAPGENSVLETRRRVVRGVCANDTNAAAVRDIYTAVESGLLIPAGRVNAGAGLDRAVTLQNCFINETVQDSMPGIQRAIARAALTMQQGGGIGTDFSTVRPRGAIVKRTGSVSSGVIPFMDQQSAMCETIVSGGSRRGAMMGTLRCDHPDLFNENQFETMTDHTGTVVLKNPSFISAKRQKGRLTQFNISVLVTDAFLAAVDNDAEWDLGFWVPPADDSHVGVISKPFPYDEINYDNEWNVLEGGRRKGDMCPWYVYRRVPARRIWEDIMHSTYVYAEPGVMFIDRINERNSLYWVEDICCSNPCGEKPMPPNSVCCLSSINLALLVINPFTDDAEFDWEMFINTVRSGVRFLDNVLDVSRYPLQAQRDDAMAKRRIGLGITGFADMLLQLRVRYGSFDSVDLARAIGSSLRYQSYRTSAILAAERGPFPLFDKQKFLAGYNVSRVLGDTRDLISQHGIRNGELNTIAPNGTISLYMGNVASGHEPVFSFEKARRKVRMDDGDLREFVSVNYGYRMYESIHGPTRRQDLPEYFVGAMDISVDEHLTVHAAWQANIDSAISKTINVPMDTSLEEFQKVYRRAYDLGCKGCTTYRPDPASGRGSVLSVDAVEVPLQQSVTPIPRPGEIAVNTTASLLPGGTPTVNTIPVGGAVSKRPEMLAGMSYKLTWPQDGKNWYINITNHDGQPYEVFLTPPNAEHQEWVVALSRMMTAVLRRGGDTRFMIDQLAEVASARGGAFVATHHKFYHSVVAAIGGVLEMEFKRLAADATRPAGFEPRHINMPITVAPLIEDLCIDCGGAMIREGGCKVCLQCGANACG